MFLIFCIPFIIPYFPTLFQSNFETKMITFFIVFNLNRLLLAENELAVLRPRVGLIEDYERQIRNLRDDITILTGRRDFTKTA